MKYFIIFSLSFLSISILFSCKSGNQTPEEFVDNLILVLIENDMEQFKDYVLTKSEIEKSLIALGTDSSQKSVNEAWKAADANTPALFKRFYSRQTNWSEVIVDSLQYDIQEKNGLQATEVMIFYTLKNQFCKLRLRRINKVGNGGWKLAQYPSFFTCVNKNK